MCHSPAKAPLGSQTWGLSSWRIPPITFSVVRTEAIRNHQEPGRPKFFPSHNPDSQPTTSGSFTEREPTCPSQNPLQPQVSLAIHCALPGIKSIDGLQFRMGFRRARNKPRLSLQNGVIRHFKGEFEGPGKEKEWPCYHGLSWVSGPEK